MDEFNKDFNLKDDNGAEQTQENATTQNSDAPEGIDTQTEKDSSGAEDFSDDASSMWGKVDYTPVKPIEDYKPMSKGLKVFCVVIAAVLLLTGTCTAGYFFGRSSVKNSYIGNAVNVDLSAKPNNTDPNTPAQIYEIVNKSIVGIRVYNAAGEASDASGVIYSKDGYIVTNDHIYSEIGAPEFKVFMYDGTEYNATYVAGDSVSDLAVLKIDAKNLQAADFGNSNELINGESVVAMGRPNDATDFTSITGGMISLTKRRVKTTSSYTSRLIQTDSAINPGSSGGALVNMYGQVVGITSSKLAGVEYDAVGFAIPTTTMKRVVEQLISDGKVTDRAKLGITYTVIGEVTDGAAIEYKDVKIALEEAVSAWEETLEKVFPTNSGAEGQDEKVETGLYDTSDIYICSHKIAQPTVFIPVMPGTNCEYDSAKAFERAGAKVITKVFRNMSASDIVDSVEVFEKAIGQSQIIMFPGGFSAGDEPDGSAKFFATAFQNAKMKEAVEKLLNERDGLALGICNGFQALIKLGLVPGGKITGQLPDSPTLTYNTIGRHISKMVYTKVVTNKSPWLREAELGGVYTNPASHGEGRFVANKEWLDRLFANGQVATQYCDPEGNITMDEEWNVNGSYCAIEGITSPDGRVLGKMAHSERRNRSVAMNIYGEQDMKIFESGVKYFR